MRSTKGRWWPLFIAWGFALKVAFASKVERLPQKSGGDWHALLFGLDFPFSQSVGPTISEQVGVYVKMKNERLAPLMVEPEAIPITHRRSAPSIGPPNVHYRKRLLDRHSDSQATRGPLKWALGSWLVSGASEEQGRKSRNAK
ncbi:MAG TPA: hypothetical protein VGP76_03965 [Planctomycetaceae bacterium]|jgi:hypothetical protein|nr:hypothetical protein [Planctomycetaceae bacterium]